MNNWAVLTLAAPLADSSAAPRRRGLFSIYAPSGRQNIGDLLDRGGLDFAVTNKPFSGRFMANELAPDSYVAVARRGHPVGADRTISGRQPRVVSASDAEFDR